MFNTDEQQLKDQLEHELDVYQFLDLLGMELRDLIDMAFESGLDEETRQKLEHAVRWDVAK